MKKIAGIFLCGIVLICTILVGVIMPTIAESVEVEISDFEASQPLATVTYGNGIVVEEVGSPVYKGSQSMKLPLQYANRDTVITYNISKDTNFPAGEKRYVSFWMSSDVNCKIKLQLPDINWGGDAFYDVDIQAGAHLYNVDVSNCTYSGVRGIIFLQKGEYYADGTDAFSGVGYLDSLVLTNAERKLPVVTTKTDTTTTTSTQPTTTVSSKASAGWMMTDFEDDQLTPKEGPYMRKGVEYDIVTSPVYSGSRSLKLIMNYDGPWTKTEWGLEPAKWENWFTLGNETKYLSFWMNSDVDCVLRFQLLDPDYADDLSLKVDVRKGTYMYNVDISQYTKTKIRGVMILLTADDYEDEDSDKDAPLWKGTAYIDSLMFTEQTRELPAVSTTTSNTTVMTVTKPDMPETGVVSSTFPIILLALGAGTFMLVVNKKRG